METNIKKNYEAWLHWYVPNNCNLNCLYCTRKKLKVNKKSQEINLSGFRRFLTSTRKTFKISFTGGGEPFLVPNIIDVCLAVTQKHYLSLVTNLTSTKIKEFANKIDPGKVTSILASVHLKELERTNLLDLYSDNFLMLKKKNFNIKATAVAHPTVLLKVGKYKALLKARGIEFNFTNFLGKFEGKTYPKSYTLTERQIFGLDQPEVKHCRYKKLCNAGYNVGVVDPRGNIYPCDLIKFKIGNIYDKVNFKNRLIICPFKHCSCPLSFYDKNLFRQALKANLPAKKINLFLRAYNFLNKQRLKYAG